MKAVVIGGGVIGLAVTDELTRRGVQVTLFERAAVLGQETSFAAAGILAPQSEADGPGPFLDLLLSAAQLVPEAVSRLESLTGVAVRHRVCGLLSLAFTEKEAQALEQALAWQVKAGMGPQRLEMDKVRSMEPSVDGRALCSVYWPQTGLLDPRQFVAAYEKAVLVQGADVLRAMPVTRIVVESGRAAGVETPAGFIGADWVVLAAGPWAGEEFGLPFEVPSVPARGQILRFETSGPMFRSVVKSKEAYLAQRSDGCLIAGTTLEYVGFDKRTTEEGTSAILEGVRRISSSAGKLSPCEAWAGLRPDTPDHLPVLGPTPAEGLLLAAGHFRNGILLAPLTGRLIADCVKGVRSSLDLTPFGISRFAQGGKRGKMVR